MRKNVDGGELCIGYFDALRVFLFVEFSTHSQTRLGSGSGDEFDDGAKIPQWFAAPVDADEREKPVLDFIPFTGPGGQWPPRAGNLSSSASFCSSIFHRRTR